MSTEYTLSIVKPDAVERNIIGKVISYLESSDLKIVAQKMLTLTKDQAEGFYAEHKERPFFADLVSYMTSGPVVLLVLKGEGAVLKNRQIMGATDPSKADAGTIRKDLGVNIEKNTVHGSDSQESALREISYFFLKSEIVA
jgi:nucleoside-diphosphate kinase